MRKADSVVCGVRVVQATVEQKPVLANLIELYCHDFCDFVGLPIGPDGRFGYSPLDSYWAGKDRVPFLILVQQTLGGREDLGGFALVHRLAEPEFAEPAWDMAEFFVLRGLRGRGVGREALRQIWRMFPGAWQVRVMEPNQAACRFWTRAIPQVVGRPVKPVKTAHAGEAWYVFSFRTEDRA